VDSRANILWRNTGAGNARLWQRAALATRGSGNARLWQIGGFAKETKGSIGAPPLVWVLEGVGDGDGERQSDII
jgi:hypothetical protein